MKKTNNPGKRNLYVPVRVRVTKNDIKLGEQCVHTSCPIARALGRLTTRKASVGYEQITIGNLRFRAPEWAKKFVEVFDETSNQNNMKPRRRTMYLPARFLKRFQEVR